MKRNRPLSLQYGDLARRIDDLKGIEERLVDRMAVLRARTYEMEHRFVKDDFVVKRLTKEVNAAGESVSEVMFKILEAEGELGG